MANKREFKKYVDAVGASICDTMTMAFYNVEGADKDGISKAIEKVLGAVAAARSNSDICFDRGVKAFENLAEYSKAKKDFFKKLYAKIDEDFSKEIDEAMKLFNNSIPQKVKDENKASV